MVKFFVLLFFTITSIVINYFLLKKVDRRFFMILFAIILTINLILFLLDIFLYRNEITDYIALEMLLSLLFSITFEDIKFNLIDTRVIIGYSILFFIYRVIFLDLTIFLEGIIGMLVSLVILLIAYFIKRNSIGIGDIEAIAACGMIIGFPNIFHFLFKTFLFVFIAGIFLMITKKRKLLTELPLAPFLLIATII